MPHHRIVFKMGSKHDFKKYQCSAAVETNPCANSTADRRINSFQSKNKANPMFPGRFQKMDLLYCLANSWLRLTPAITPFGLQIGTTDLPIDELNSRHNLQ